MISRSDIRKYLNKLHKERALEIVKQMSRGNYCMSQGLMVTKEELDGYFGIPQIQPNK